MTRSPFLLLALGLTERPMPRPTMTWTSTVDGPRSSECADKPPPGVLKLATVGVCRRTQWRG